MSREVKLIPYLLSLIWVLFFLHSVNSIKAQDSNDSLKTFNKPQVKIKNNERNDRLNSVVLTHLYSNIPILSSKIVYSIDYNGYLVYLGTDVFYNINLPNVPSINKSSALDKVNKYLQGHILKEI